MLYHGDFYPILCAQEDQSVDLIVSDFPYEWTDLTKWFAEFKRVIKPTGSIYCFGDPRIVAEHWYAQMPFRIKKPLVWYYKNSPKPKGNWRMAHQSIIFAMASPDATFNEDEGRVPYTPGAKKLHGRERPSGGRYKKKKKYNTSKGALPRDVIEVPALTGHRARERFGHSDQKPLELVELLIKVSSNPGDFILDPTVGTGTSLVAAKKLGRKYVGGEIAKKWYNVAKKRLENVEQPEG